MANDREEDEFNDRLCARVAAFRLEKGWKQIQMALALGIPLERYKKYEKRTPMPSYLLPRFALIVDKPLEFVMTGKYPVIPFSAKSLNKKGLRA